MKAIFRWIISALLFFAIGFSSTVCAVTISTPAADWGWYRSDGLNQPVSDNYITGLHVATSVDEFRSWFVFDLSGISLGTNEIISSASLSIVVSGNYVSQDASEQLGMASVEGNVNDIMLGHAAGNSAGVNIYNDLKNGDVYGSRDVSSIFFNNNTSINIGLTGPNALSRLTNGLGGLFAVGGYIDTINLSSFSSQELFAASGGFPSAQSAAVLQLVIVSINNEPAGTDSTVTTNENTSFIFAAANFGFSDIDGNALNAVKITTLESVGVLQWYNGAAWVDVTAGQTISRADIDLDYLRFTPIANTNGVSYDSFTFQVQDNGGTANGGVDLDQSANTIAINVNPLSLRCDLNNNSEIDVGDLVQVQRMIIDAINDNLDCDINNGGLGDGVISVADFLVVIRMVLGDVPYIYY